MATTKKEAKGLKRGDAVVVKDRLWAIVTPSGQLAWAYPDTPVFVNRKDALTVLGDSKEENWTGSDSWRLARLNDVTGTVV